MPRVSVGVLVTLFLTAGCSVFGQIDYGRSPGVGYGQNGATVGADYTMAR
jgi:hypothetical protein